MSDPQEQESTVDGTAGNSNGTEQVLGRLKRALTRKYGDKAARIFKEACTEGFIPSDNNLLTWLQNHLGRDETAKLIAVFAGLACFYCENGIIPCEECSGHGHDGHGTLCTVCLALGISRCDFCGGSGWYTMFHVPAALQLPVILRRVAAATQDAEMCLAPDTHSDSTPAELRKRAAKALIKVNRCLGVMENMATAAQQVQSRSPESGERCGKVIAVCESLGGKLRDRACVLLKELSHAARMAAKSATRKAKKQLLDKQAALYGDLAASRNFRGTSLHHPLLFPSERALPPDEITPIDPEESLPIEPEESD